MVEQAIAGLDVKTFSISALAREFGLSRSTLLYYDRIGLLPPSGRRGSGYRYYTLQDQRRLGRICHFRNAGLSLRDIQALLASRGKPPAKVLEARICQTNDSIRDLKNQQKLLTQMLKRLGKTGSQPVDKALWVEMLRAAGMDESAMEQWHAEFERRAPMGHQEFLASLGLPEKEIVEIRRWSARHPSQPRRNPNAPPK